MNTDDIDEIRTAVREGHMTMEQATDSLAELALAESPPDEVFEALPATTAKSATAITGMERPPRIRVADRERFSLTLDDDVLHQVEVATQRADIARLL